MRVGQLDRHSAPASSGDDAHEHYDPVARVEKALDFKAPLGPCTPKHGGYLRESLSPSEDRLALRVAAGKLKLILVIEEHAERPIGERGIVAGTHLPQIGKHRVPAAHYLHVLPRHRLIRKAGCFEGTARLAELLHARKPTFAERHCQIPALIDTGTTISPGSPLAARDERMIAARITHLINVEMPCSSPRGRPRFKERLNLLASVDPFLRPTTQRPPYPIRSPSQSTAAQQLDRRDRQPSLPPERSPRSA